jgi:hypothetical protein
MASLFPTARTSVDEIQPELDRVLNSDTFRKTPSLRHFLQYIVSNTIEGHADRIKESNIAIDVFSRREEFDGRIDNIVRVQAHRLRKLLETYYSEEGRDDRYRFSVPKGSYIPQIEIRERQQAFEATIQLAPAEVEVREPVHAPAFEIPHAPPAEVSKRRTRVSTAAIFLAGLATGVLIWVMLLLFAPAAKRQQTVASPVKNIWSAAFEPGIKVVAAFTNPAFLRVGNSLNLLRYLGPLSAPSGAEIELPADDPYIDHQFVPKGAKLRFNDSWTGVGEVLAVNRLTSLAIQLGRPMSVLPSRALSLDDMHGANVVFIGSPWVNGALAQMGSANTPLYETGDGRIVVRNPAPGEQAAYSNRINAVTREITAAYALFSVLPGIDAARSVFCSAGLGTAATWAAIDFSTSPAGAAQLVRALKKANGGTFPRHYQAIIRTEIVKESATNTSLITVRVIP